MKDFDIISYINENFKYNTDGTLTRYDRKNSNGSMDKDGYLILKIKGRQYKAHRIIFALHNGRMPEKEIDHINRIRTDNRIENLRETDRQGNVENTTKRRNPNTGEYGIYIDTTNGLKKKFAFAYKQQTYRFYTLEDAVKERKALIG